MTEKNCNSCAVVHVPQEHPGGVPRALVRKFVEDLGLRPDEVASFYVLKHGISVSFSPAGASTSFRWIANIVDEEA